MGTRAPTLACSAMKALDNFQSQKPYSTDWICFFTSEIFNLCTKIPLTQKLEMLYVYHKNSKYWDIYV